MKGTMLFVFALFALSVLGPAVAGAIDCPICEFLVGQAEKYVAENATQSEIITYMDDACKVLTSQKWITDCEGLVSTYAPQIIQKLVNKETPDQICIDLTLCTSSAAVPQPIKKEGSLECTLCALIVGYAEKYVEQNKTINETLSFIEGECKLLHDKAWITTCQGAVATYGPQIIQLVINKEPADVICSQVGLCSNSTAKVTIQINNAPTVVAPVTDDYNLTCSICEFLVNFFEEYIAENITESEMIARASVVCSVVPDRLIGAACQEMVNEYGAIIIAGLINGGSAGVVCIEHELCPSPSGTAKVTIQINNSPTVVAPVTDDDNLTCPICEFLVSIIEEYIAVNNTEKIEIISQLINTCSLLWSTAAAECHEMVAEYGDIIITYLINGGSAGVVCIEYELCPSSSGNSSIYNTKKTVTVDVDTVF